MADAYTNTASLSIDQTAYDLMAYHALRPQLIFDAMADVKPTRQSMPGTAVVFTIISDLSIATTALNQSTDVDAVAMSDSQVTVTLVERGNAVITTKLIRSTGFIPLDPEVANVVGFNAGRSINAVARERLAAGTNVRYATGGATDPTSRTTIEPSDTLVAWDVRRALADLRGANVVPFGTYYGAVIHPDVSFDLRGETGAAAWRDPHTYSEPANIWSGEIGAFEGFRFVENSEAKIWADAGSSTTLTDVYGTLFLGRQALAKAYSSTDGNGPYPTVRPGPVTDKLWRNVPVGWYWLGDYAEFRAASLRRVESASSIGANA